MHEASIALELVKLACQTAQPYQSPIKRIGVRIGKLSSVIPEALTFAFPEAAQGTLAQNAVLDIAWLNVIANCAQCGEVPINMEQGLRCPSCGQPTPHIVQGEELELDTLEF